MAGSTLIFSKSNYNSVVSGVQGISGQNGQPGQPGIGGLWDTQRGPSGFVFYDCVAAHSQPTQTHINQLEVEREYFHHLSEINHSFRYSVLMNRNFIKDISKRHQ